jgi:hypothetical protein
MNDTLSGGADGNPPFNHGDFAVARLERIVFRVLLCQISRRPESPGDRER